MDPQEFPYIPHHIVLRRYEEIDIYDLKEDESYIIDEEAYTLLKLIDGAHTNEEILASFSENKKQEIIEVLNSFHELNIIHSSPTKNINSLVSINHLDLPEKNPFNHPYLKNLMINITEKCNLTCKHCYIKDKNSVDFTFAKLKKIVADFYKLQGIKLVLTGGEPLLYNKLRDLLIFLKAIPIAKILLTNGVLLEEKSDLIDLLKVNNFEIFVSIDGLEDTHNDFRDADCFQDSIEGIKLLLKKKNKVSINTMVHKQNLNEFADLLKLIKSLGNIMNWTIDIPTFDKSTPKFVRDKYKVTAEEGGEILRGYGWGEFYGSESYDFACGPNIMAIDALGVVTKCGFFYDENVGNVFDLGLKKSWELIQKNLNWRISDLNCCKLGCEYLESCRGGCRYRAYQATGDIRGIDSYKCAQFGKLNE